MLSPELAFYLIPVTVFFRYGDVHSCDGGAARIQRLQDFYGPSVACAGGRLFSVVISAVCRAA